MKNSDKYLSLKENKKTTKLSKDKTKGNDKLNPDTVNVYNFDDTMDYYDSRDEYDFVGIIDKELSRRKNKSAEEMKDIFKVRPKLPKILDKKRGTGIPSLRGAVCETAKSKAYLDSTAKKLGAELKPGMTRTDICSVLEQTMLHKEKYATDKNKDKFTYIRIPANHPKYPFPYNLEDRINFIVAKIRQNINLVIDISTSKNTVKSGPNKGLPEYKIIIKKKPQLDEYTNFFKNLGAVQTKDEWHIVVD